MSIDSMLHGLETMLFGPIPTPHQLLKAAGGNHLKERRLGLGFSDLQEQELLFWLQFKRGFKVSC